MKIFVAGASGALGVPFLKELQEHGHHVTAMARSNLRYESRATLQA